MQPSDTCVTIDQYTENRVQAAQELQNTVAQYSAAMFRLAYRFLHNTEEAEDAVQDAVFSAYTHLGDFRGESQMATWLHAIVVNCARARLRKQRRHVHVSLDTHVDEEDGNLFSELLRDDRPSPEEECQRSELNERLLELITSLPPGLRRTYHLHYVHQLSICEIASALGIPHGTVKARLSRARGRLIPPLRRRMEKNVPKCEMDRIPAAHQQSCAFP
jgi:RNA polymerase sigma-70 factor (ECF subfamily)